MNIIEDYHQNNTKLLTAIASNPKNGYWVPSCANHVYSWGPFYDSNYRIPANSEYSLVKSIVDWMNQTPTNHSHADSGNWPINKPCSGLKLSQINPLQ